MGGNSVGNGREAVDADESVLGELLLLLLFLLLLVWVLGRGYDECDTKQV